MRSVLIEGAGLAGQVLHRELTLKGIPSRLTDRAAFPRDKVCGGILQADSWDYLNSVFDLPNRFRRIGAISHFWHGKKLSRVILKEPMFFISRFVLDDALNRQQKTPVIEPDHCFRVKASGARHPKGEWIGFQGETEPVEEIQMHYGRGIYLGISPMTEGKSHVAMIVKKRLFKNQERLRDFIKKELGLKFSLPLKGTGAIHYHASSSEGLAVGDAKLVTHPFLGLGMKHAILSARLLAKLISEGREDQYPALHKSIFRKYRWASWISGKLYDSPFRSALKPLLQNSALFLSAYHALHHGEMEFYGASERNVSLG